MEISHFNSIFLSWIPDALLLVCIKRTSQINLLQKKRGNSSWQMFKKIEYSSYQNIDAIFISLEQRSLQYHMQRSKIDYLSHIHTCQLNCQKISKLFTSYNWINICSIFIFLHSTLVSSFSLTILINLTSDKIISSDYYSRSILILILIFLLHKNHSVKILELPRQRFI
jgi:hypothetical protein